MKFTVNTKEFKKLIESVIGSVAQKASTPVFSGIHVTAKDNTVTVCGSQYNSSMRNACEATVESEGMTLVVAERIHEVIKSLEGDTVTLDDETGVLRVAGGNITYQLLTMDANNYPPFPAVNPDAAVTIPVDEFNKLVKQTIFACSEDENRKVFTGLLIEVMNGKLKFVGTNTHRLAIAECPAPDVPFSAIIPAAMLKLVIKLFTDGDITLSLDKNRMVMTHGNWQFVTTVIDGKFPDYNRLILTRFTNTFSANRTELAKVVARVRLCNTEAAYPVRFYIENGVMWVRTEDSDYGTSEEKTTVQYTGEDKFKISFNGKYLAETLKALTGETVTFNMNRPLDPVTVVDEKKEVLHIITPLRSHF